MRLKVLGISSLLGGRGGNGLEASLSRGCLAARVAPEKLAEAMETDTRVKIWEAWLAGESLGMAALSGHPPPHRDLHVYPSCSWAAAVPSHPHDEDFKHFYIHLYLQWQIWFAVSSVWMENRDFPGANRLAALAFKARCKRGNPPQAMWLCPHVCLSHTDI